MNTFETLSTAIAATAIFFSGSLSGAVIAAWDLSGVDLDNAGASGIDGNATSSPYTFSAGTSDEHLQTAQISLSSSVSSSTGAGRYGFKVSAGTNSLAGAIDSNHYIQFDLQAKPGFLINLVSLEMYGQSTSTGANNVAVLSSVDGFSGSAAIASVNEISGVTGGFDTDVSGFGSPISLAESKFQELSTITFRI